MLTRSAKWMAAISVLFFTLALGMVLGMIFEARTSRGLASEVASPRGPAIVSGAPVLQSGAGTAFTYHGRLEDAGGLAENLHDFRFRLFDDALDGNQVGETLCADNIAVSGGLFTVLLDFGQQYATPDPRFLEIEVRRDSGLDCTDETGFVLLAPRQQLTATPLASHANAAFALDAPDGSPASAVFVDNDGKVGIGTTSPFHWLHVAVPAPVLALQDTDSAGAEQVGYVSFRDSANVERGWVGFGSPSTFDITVANNTFTGTTSLGAGGLERLTVTPGGNVGVGTTLPSAKLDVRGDIRLGPSGQFRATSGEENLRIIRGVVTATGSIIVGSGFTVSRTDTGRYTITFNTPFVAPPTVTATTEFTELKPSYVTTDGVFTNRVNLRVWEDNGTFNNMKNDAFHFIAIGPR